MLEKQKLNKPSSNETSVTFKPEEFITILKEMEAGPNRTPAEREDLKQKREALEQSLERKQNTD